MRFLIRLILLIAVFLLLRSLLEPVIKAVAAIFSPASPPSQASPGAEASSPGTKSAELKKDPVCGTFIAPEIAITQKFNGQIFHFCSQKCRDAYAAAHRG